MDLNNIIKTKQYYRFILPFLISLIVFALLMIVAYMTRNVANLYASFGASELPILTYFLVNINRDLGISLIFNFMAAIILTLPLVFFTSKLLKAVYGLVLILLILALYAGLMLPIAQLSSY